MYPTVVCLLRLWDILTAECIALVDCTEEFRVLLTNATLAQAFDPSFCRLLACFVELEPEDDTLPARGKSLGVVA